MGRGFMVASKQQVSEALDRVIDPHFKVGLNDMGMITDIDLAEGGDVEVSMRTPCIGCPAWTMMQHDVKSKVGALDGVGAVKIKVDWTKPWTRDDMSQAARDNAESHGYVI